MFRTDNAVKNHFYSTLRRSLRRINKFYGFKNSTNQMKNLKPSTLTFLIEKSNESTQSKSINQNYNLRFNKKNIRLCKIKTKKEQLLTVKFLTISEFFIRKTKVLITTDITRQF